MADTDKQITPEQARELIRNGNPDKLRDDPRAVDALNQSVIAEFRANQGRSAAWKNGRCSCSP